LRRETSAEELTEIACDLCWYLYCSSAFAQNSLHRVLRGKGKAESARLRVKISRSGDFFSQQGNDFL